MQYNICWFSSNPIKFKETSTRNWIQPNSINLSIYPSVHLSIYPSIHLSIYLSIHLSINLSIYFFCLSICPSIDLSIYQSIYLSIHLSIHLSIYPSIYPSIHLSIDLSIYLSIYLSTYPSIYLPYLPIHPSILCSWFDIASICLSINPFLPDCKTPFSQILKIFLCYF